MVKLYNAQREVLDTLIKGSEVKGKVPALWEERKALTKRKKEFVGKIDEVRKGIQVLWDALKTQEAAYRAFQVEEMKVRDAERKAKKEAYEKQQEEEEAKKVPYETEMALCDDLANHLRTRYPTGASPAADTPAAAAEGNQQTATALKVGNVTLQPMR